MLSSGGTDTPLVQEGSPKGSGDLVQGVECANTAFVWVVLVSLAPLGFFGPQHPAALVSIHAAPLRKSPECLVGAGLVDLCHYFYAQHSVCSDCSAPEGVGASSVYECLSHGTGCMSRHREIHRSSDIYQ